MTNEQFLKFAETYLSSDLYRHAENLVAFFNEIEKAHVINCEYMHHTKKDYHRIGTPCPVVDRIQNIIDKLSGDKVGDK
jgi:hypothetical protein